jgi:hypothetical protein
LQSETVLAINLFEKDQYEELFVEIAAPGIELLLVCPFSYIADTQ